MKDIKILDNGFECPRCGYENKPTVIEIEADGDESTKCLQCQVYFRKGAEKGSRFESADKKHIFIDEV